MDDYKNYNEENLEWYGDGQVMIDFIFRPEHNFTYSDEEIASYEALYKDKVLHALKQWTRRDCLTYEQADSVYEHYLTLYNKHNLAEYHGQ